MAEADTFQAKHRSLKGFPRILAFILLGGLTVSGIIWVSDLPSYLNILILREQYLGLFWAFGLSGVFLVYPSTRSADRTRVPWYDWLALVLSLVVGLNLTLFYPTLLFESALATPDKYLLGLASMLLLIEATRRLLGRSLLIILLVFLLYGATAEYFPGLMNGNGVTLKRLMIYMYIDTNALLGIPLVVASTIVLVFILFGQMLFASGGGTFFTDLAMATMGRYRGGPAKTAVVASSLFGTISGTAVSNVVTTGIITIPLMKKNHYSPEVAGAVEAVASTGGQIMPPVMGAAAFLIAEFLDMPYSQVIKAALVPALLYYLLLFIQVDLEAAKHGISRLKLQELPKTGAVLLRGWWFIIPLPVLFYTLFWLNYRAGKAGLWAVLSLIVLMAIRAVVRMIMDPAHNKPRDVATRAGMGTLEIITGTGRSLLEITMIVGVAGTIIGVLNLSGLGFSISMALEAIGGNSLILLLILSAFLFFILGMGMPTASVYILLAVMIAPALIKLGLEPIAAHLFILYFGLLSMITPPVAIAAYAAAAISGSEPMRTGWTSVRLGAMAYIVPFIFIYSPELLLMGQTRDILWAITSTAVGAFWLGVGLSGYLFRPLSVVPRILLIASAMAMFVNHGALNGLGYGTNLAGLAIGLALLKFERVQSRGTTAPSPTSSAAETTE